MRFYHVRCMFAGLWRHDAAAAQMADPLMTRYNGSSLLIDCGEGNTDCNKRKRLGI